MDESGGEEKREFNRKQMHSAGLPLEANLRERGKLRT